MKLRAIYSLVLLFVIFLETAAIEVRICTRTIKEQDKCEWLRDVVDNRNYSTSVTTREVNKVGCVAARDNYECLQKIEAGEADVVNLDAGTAYYASNNFVSTLLNIEVYPGTTNSKSYYSVAVVPKSSNVYSAAQLRGSRLCSTGVGDVAGWTLPLALLAEKGILEVTACNVNVKTASSFFSSMCAPGSLHTLHNPFGDNPVSTCRQCGSTGREWCTYRDKYAGGEGAMACIKDGQGDVTFMRSVDLDYLTQSHYGKQPQFNQQDFELLCPNGGRKAIGSYNICNWGEIAANVIITSGTRSAQDQESFRKFFVKLSDEFPPLSQAGAVLPPVASDPNATTPSTTTLDPNFIDPNGDPFTLFNTNSSYGLNSLVSSQAVKLDRELRDGFQYIDGTSFQRKLDALQQCSLSSVRFCVISEYEMRKCEQMLLALRSSNLKPGLDCILDSSTKNCMKKIEDGDADIIVLDAGDVYEAGKYHGLVPIANENYGDTGNFYYSVAVSRKTEGRLTLFNLIARNSCHGSMRSATGWIYPVLSLIETGQISPGKCDAIKKVGELFRRSCVPGVLDEQYNKEGTNPVNLCENCAAGGMDKCQRNTRELYYGDSGAFRCLVEMGGDIAYVRHMTPRDNTDGRNADHWARNRRSDDYELLCKNGRRAALNSWNSCYLAKVPARAVVTASYKTTEERQIFWNLLNYAQQFYSADSHPYFTMFDSGVDQDDLLFSDSTVRLVEVNPDNQTYEQYLGTSFLKAVNTLNQFDCASGQETVTISFLLMTLSAFICQLSL